MLASVVRALAGLASLIEGNTRRMPRLQGQVGLPLHKFESMANTGSGLPTVCLVFCAASAVGLLETGCNSDRTPYVPWTGFRWAARRSRSH